MAKEQAKDPSIDQCIEINCKAKQQRLHFCDTHYGQMKFGAIKINGLHPTDYEKKLGHHAKYLAKAGIKA